MFQHVLAVAVGLAPLLGMEIPKMPDLPEKEVEISQTDGTKKSVANPAYVDAMVKFADDMLSFLPRLQLRIGSATDAAEGLNVLYENLRRQRSMNFANEVIKKKKGEMRFLIVLKVEKPITYTCCSLSI